jgi:hypothetical protein
MKISFIAKVLCFNQFAQLSDAFLHRLVLLLNLFDFFAGVQDGAMVASTEIPANIGQRKIGQFSGQIHGDLPWECDFPSPSL